MQLLVLAGAGLALFLALMGRGLSSAQMLLGDDAIQLFLPLKAFLASELRAGHWPGWFPYDGLGASMAGSLVPGILDPSNVLLFLRPTQAVKWATCLSYPIAALGAYLLARRLGLKALPAALAGAAFALSGVMLSQSQSLQYVGAFSRIPFALWAAERLASRPDWRRAPPLGLALASILWAGDPEAFVGAAVVCALVLARVHPKRLIGPAALAGLVGTLLLLPLVLPAMGTFGGSGRAGSLDPEEALTWSLHPIRLLELALGSPFPLEHGYGAAAVRWGGQNASFWSASVFMGTAVLFLALHGVLRPGARRVRAFYGALFAVPLLLALGRYAGVYPHLGVLMHFRYPEKLMVWPSLAAAVLAGRGLQHARTARLGPHLVFFGSALAAAAVLASMALPQFLWLGARGVIALVGVAAATRLAARPRMIAIAAIAAVELLGVNRGLLNFGREDAWLGATPFPEIPPEERLCSDLGVVGYQYEGSGWELMRHAQLGSLDNGYQALFHYRSATGLIPSWPRAIRELCSVADACNDACARVVGARFDVVQPEAVDPLLARGGYRLVRRLELPRAALLEDLRAPPYASVRPAKTYADEWNTVVELHQRALDPDAQALLPRAELSDPERWAGRGEVDVQRERPDAIGLTTHASAAGVLVVHEGFDPQWTARLDGQPARLLRANLGMLGVLVPAGEHRVELRFVPWGQPWTYLGYALGLMLCALALVRPRHARAASTVSSASLAASASSAPDGPASTQRSGPT